MNFKEAWHAYWHTDHKGWMLFCHHVDAITYIAMGLAAGLAIAHY